MTSLGRALRGLLAGGPWFVRRPRVAIGVALTMFAVIFGLGVGLGAAASDICLLFALPIALIAVAFGMRAGVASGCAGVVLVALAAHLDRVNLTAVGWISRVAPMLLLGYLLGDAVDRLHRAEARQRRLEQAARRQRDAIEINDTIVQGLSAAKWALEAGDLNGGLRIVEDTLHLGHRLVSELIRGADMASGWAGGGRPGFGPATGTDAGRHPDEDRAPSQSH